MPRRLKNFLSIGLMSGTSLDGVDAVLLRARARGNRYEIKVLNHYYRSYPSRWAERIRRISERDELRNAYFFSALWSEMASDVCKAMCEQADTELSQVHCVGAHGQTVAHIPQPKKFLNRRLATSVQLVDISRLALRTRLPVVGNFRMTDIAAGGEGAPLAPHGHRLLFSQARRRLGVLNIGGISNITVLQGYGIESAFDIGPGNIWIDFMARKKTNGRMKFDRNGNFARAGTPNPKVMKRLLQHPYFRRRPPKSCGWEEFGESFLKRFENDFSKLSRNDALATVTHATSWAISDAVDRIVLGSRGKLRELVVTGGGAKNRFLLELLSERMPTVPIKTSDYYDIAVSAVEAASFALFAVETLRGRPITNPETTGANETGLSGEIALGDGKSVF